MIRGALSHLALSMTDLKQLIPFYDAILPLLGYRRMSVDEGTTAAACWSIEDENGKSNAVLRPACGRILPLSANSKSNRKKPCSKVNPARQTAASQSRESSKHIEKP